MKTKKNRKNHKEISSRYFEKTDDIYNCKFCEKIFDLSKSNLSNLTSHLEIKHNMKFPLNQPFMLNHKDISYNPNSILEVFTKFILTSTRPVNILNDTSFIELIQTLNPDVTIPTSYMVKQQIFTEQQKYYNLINQIISEADFISICVDIWSFNGAPLFASYISGMFKDIKFFNLFLSLREIDSQHSVKIKDHMLTLIKEFKINKNILLSITTDNCYSMIRANEDLIQTLESENTNLMKEEANSNFSEEEIFDIKNSITNKNITNCIKKVFFNEYKIIQIGCIIHKIQLILKKTFKEVNWANDLIDKISKFIKITRKPKYRTYNLKCPNPIETRWNSIYVSINYFYKRRDKYDILIQEKNLDEIEFSEYEWKQIFFIKTILQKFYKVTKKIENNVGTLSYFFQWHQKITIKLENISSNTNTDSNIQEFIKILQDNFIHYLASFNQEFSTFKLVSFYLHPNLFYNLSKTDKNKAKNLIKEIYQMYDEEPVFSQYFPKIEFVTDQDPLEALQSSDDGYQNNEALGEQVRDEIISIGKELTIYERLLKRMKKEDEEDFWLLVDRKIPKLSMIRNIMDGFGGSNGSIEQLFSTCKQLSVWKRNKISTNSMEARLCGLHLEKIRKLLRNK